MFQWRKEWRDLGLAVVAAFLVGVHPESAQAVGRSALYNEPCPEVAVFGARGSGEGRGAGGVSTTSAPTENGVSMGLIGSLVESGIEARMPAGRQVWAAGVDFPAPTLVDPAGGLRTARDLALAFPGFGYARSIAAGVRHLLTDRDGLVSLALACSNVRIVLVGYSAGAQVLVTALADVNKLSHDVLRRIAAVILFGDPLRNASATYDRGSDSQGILRAAATAGGVINPPWGVPNLPAELTSRTRSYCAAQDIICDPGIGSSIGPHLGYMDGPYVAESIAFASEQLLGS